jgi:uncharacterized OB-fold protein
MTPSPLPDPDFAPTRPFFQGAARGRLCIPRCRACRAWVWYPEESCPGCGEASPVWEDVSGRGTLYSWAVVRRALWKPFADRVPYATGLVALEEDCAVRLVTTLVDCTPDELRVGLPVHAVFRPLRFAEEARELVVPFFTPTR